MLVFSYFVSLQKCGPVNVSKLVNVSSLRGMPESVDDHAFPNFSVLTSMN